MAQNCLFHVVRHLHHLLLQYLSPLVLLQNLVLMASAVHLRNVEILQALHLQTRHSLVKSVQKHSSNYFLNQAYNFGTLNYSTTAPYQPLTPLQIAEGILQRKKNYGYIRKDIFDNNSIPMDPIADAPAGVDVPHIFKRQSNPTATWYYGNMSNNFSISHILYDGYFTNLATWYVNTSKNDPNIKQSDAVKKFYLYCKN